jgi:hypothetical protein
MARKSKKTSPSSNNYAKADLGLSDLRVRLNFLDKENEKILKQIEKSRTELNNLNSSIEEIGIQLAKRSAPFRQKMLELDSQIHEVFKQIFTGRKLGKKSRQDIETIYCHLQADGIISPNHYSLGSETFEVNAPNSDEPDWENYEKRSTRGFREDFAEDFSKPDREELKKIRQIFLRLAEVFHPDKVADEAQREYCTEVMKEINQAYQNGDLAKLLAIEKQQELGQVINYDSADDLTRQCTKVEAENTFLKDQLGNLKRQLRLTKNTQQGSIIAEFKKITKLGGDPIGQVLGQIEDQIEVIDQLYKFAVDFRDRRITIKEFLKGPSAFRMQDDLSEEELLLEFLSRY